MSVSNFISSPVNQSQPRPLDKGGIGVNAPKARGKPGVFFLAIVRHGTFVRTWKLFVRFGLRQLHTLAVSAATADQRAPTTEAVTS